MSGLEILPCPLGWLLTARLLGGVGADLSLSISEGERLLVEGYGVSEGDSPIRLGMGEP